MPTQEPLVPKEPVADRDAIIVRALEAGCPKRFACHLAGVSEHWFYERRREDLDFEALTDAAVARGVDLRIGRINGHAKRNWQADAWMLARTHPKEFAEPSVALNQQLNLSTGPTNIVVVGPERAAILATRYEQIRAKTKQLLSSAFEDGNGAARNADTETPSNDGGS